MTDEEKLRVSVEAFKWKLDQIETWDQFKTLLDNLTKEQIKNFLKNQISANADSYRVGAAANVASAINLDTLVEEYDGI